MQYRRSQTIPVEAERFRISKRSGCLHGRSTNHGVRFFRVGSQITYRNSTTLEGRRERKELYRMYVKDLSNHLYF